MSSNAPSDWRNGNLCAFHHCNQSLIPGVDILGSKVAHHQYSIVYCYDSSFDIITCCIYQPSIQCIQCLSVMLYRWFCVCLQDPVKRYQEFQMMWMKRMRVSLSSVLTMSVHQYSACVQIRFWAIFTNSLSVTMLFNLINLFYSMLAS